MFNAFPFYVKVFTKKRFDIHKIYYIFLFSMYDVDGNGWIDLEEMTKLVKSIYQVMGPQARTKGMNEPPEVKAKNIFKRMDVNKVRHRECSVCFCFNCLLAALNYKLLTVYLTSEQMDQS